ncbi:hypothetical protein EYF80_053546 [Liparis tanakae]|uniref:Uncharacterized protein n=1 Tax=Liparis tanakae TaxID=230148 RepID=A0A4Z2F596_9TELE|nr:hypothetical protein EYF80_053546 [Liparis tanakae]
MGSGDGAMPSPPSTSDSSEQRKPVRASLRHDQSARLAMSRSPGVSRSSTGAEEEERESGCGCH